jgi:hypothetical protein
VRGCHWELQRTIETLTPALATPTREIVPSRHTEPFVTQPFEYARRARPVSLRTRRFGNLRASLRAVGPNGLRPALEARRQPTSGVLASERADLHRPLDSRDAEGVVFLRSAADEQAESAADVPGGAVARLEIAEDVQLVPSEL